MTYETVSSVAQIAGLLIFIVLFSGAVAYALWPGNKERFKRASESLLNDDKLED